MQQKCFYSINPRLETKVIEMVDPEFEVYKDNAGEWRWRFQASNSKIIATSSEGYVNKQDCEHGIDLVKEEAPKAKVVYK